MLIFVFIHIDERERDKEREWISVPYDTRFSHDKPSMPGWKT